MTELTTTKPKPFCFVLMRFNKKFDDVYQLGIKEACAKAGAYCERVDEQIYHETILDRVYNQIARADFLIADMTERNPNVFYEVGYAHALGKPTILLTLKADDIPFDLKHFPHIVYQNRIADLLKDLTRRVQWFVTHPDRDAGRGTIDIEIYLGEDNLSSGSFIFDCRSYLELDITIHNASVATFAPGEFKIGVVSPSEWVFPGGKVSETQLPDGRDLHTLPDFPTLFPE